MFIGGEETVGPVLSRNCNTRKRESRARMVRKMNLGPWRVKMR